MNNSKDRCVWRLVIKLATLAFLSSVGYMAKATDIEPRSYSNIPVGVNFFVAGHAYTRGSVSFPPPVPIKNGQLSFHSPVLAYSRSLDIWGRSGKVDIILPAASISGTADVLGEPRSRNILGLADPRARFYVNLFGAPALSMKDFADYRQNVIVGVSLAVTPPGGQYDPDKLINIGSNRWSFKPEIGVSKAWGKLTAEIAAGAYLFTDNSQPFKGAASSRIRFIRCRVISSTVLRMVFGGLSTSIITPAAALQQMARRLTTAWKAGGSAVHWPFLLTGSIRSSYTAAPAFITELAAISMSSVSPGSTVGAEVHRSYRLPSTYADKAISRRAMYFQDNSIGIKAVSLKSAK